MKFIELLVGIDHPIVLIQRGIISAPQMEGLGLTQAEMGLSQLNDIINISIEKLLIHYKQVLPGSVADIYRLISYILEKFSLWIQTDSLKYNNSDAEIFLEAFDQQVEKLKEILKEIDNENHRASK